MIGVSINQDAKILKRDFLKSFQPILQPQIYLNIKHHSSITIAPVLDCYLREIFFNRLQKNIPMFSPLSKIP